MFKRFLAAMAALMLATAIFGAVTAAPAQAVTGTSVEFIGRGAGVPATIDLYNTHMSGATSVQEWGAIKYDVKTTCPKNDNWKIAWLGANNNWVFADPGQCRTWTTDGRKSVYVFTADQSENI